MKAAGFVLLGAGLALVLSTFILLPLNSLRGAFILAGIAVQVLGLVLTFRAHLTPDEGR